MAGRAESRAAGIATDPANREKDDFYPTPPAGTLALLSVESFVGPIWEPACGDGAICKVLVGTGHEVIATDLVDRGYGRAGVDFLMETKPAATNIITNPPFKLATPFLRKALHLTEGGGGKVALLLRLAFLEGKERGEIFASSPLARVWVFSRRLSMQRGRLDPDQKCGMMAFAWFVWDHAHTGWPELGWI